MAETAIIKLGEVPDEFLTPLPHFIHLGLPPFPFILVKPMSLEWVDVIRQETVESGLKIESEGIVEGFETYARFTYNLQHGPTTRFRWLQLARALDPVCHNRAHVFILHLSEFEDYDRILETKFRIREVIGEVTYFVRLQDDDTIHAMTINHLHVPDRNNIIWECNLLVHLLAATPLDL